MKDLEKPSWINTEVALPAYKELVLFIPSAVGNVKKFSSCDVFIGYRIISAHPFNKDSFYSCDKDKIFSTRNILFWMPIPSLPENPEYIDMEKIKDEYKW